MALQGLAKTVYMREYRRTHPAQRSPGYMREYMQRWREKRATLALAVVTSAAGVTLDKAQWRVMKKQGITVDELQEFGSVVAVLTHKLGEERRTREAKEARIRWYQEESRNPLTAVKVECLEAAAVDQEQRIVTLEAAAITLEAVNASVAETLAAILDHNTRLANRITLLEAERVLADVGWLSEQH